MRVKKGVLQFVLIKPITAIAAILCEEYGIYKEGSYSWDSGFFYLSCITNISISVSLYCLILHYIALEDRLKSYQPLYKFLTVKAVLFFSFYQSCAFWLLWSYFDLMDKEIAEISYNLIICFEMMLVAWAQSRAFHWRQFQPDRDENLGAKYQIRKDQNCCVTMCKVLFCSTKDVIDDVDKTFLRDENDP